MFFLRRTAGIILAAASGKAKKQELAGAIRTLDTAGVKLLGMVVTLLPTKGPDSYGYGAYTYGSTHELEQAEVGISPARTRLRRTKKSKAKA